MLYRMRQRGVLHARRYVVEYESVAYEKSMDNTMGREYDVVDRAGNGGRCASTHDNSTELGHEC